MPTSDWKKRPRRSVTCAGSQVPERTPPRCATSVPTPACPAGPPASAAQPAGPSSPSTSSTPIGEAASPAGAETATGNRLGRTTAVATPPCGSSSPPTWRNTAPSSPPSAPDATATAASRGVARMWHDAWPPLPPGGHRPPDAPPCTSPGDQPLAVGLGAAAGAGALVWATGQAAGLAFGHTWLELSPADVAHVLWHLPGHWSDPALAWPADVRGPLPGPAGMYASFAGLVGGLSGGTAAVLRHLPGRAAGHRPGHPRPAKHAGAVWAHGRELRLLTVGEPEPGRVILGRTQASWAGCWPPRTALGPGLWPHRQLQDFRPGHPRGPRMDWPAGGDLGEAGPAAGHPGPPRPAGPRGGDRPLGRLRGPGGEVSPLASCLTWAGAQQTAVQLANAIEQTPTEEQRPEHRFWKTWAPSSWPPCSMRPPPKAWAWPRSCIGSTAARTRRSRPSWTPPGCRPPWMPGNRRSTAPTGPWTRCMRRPRRSWPSTATSASQPPPTATTSTWTGS